MNTVELSGNKYEVIKVYNDAYDKETLVERWTDDFSDYDYIVGDFASDRLRLKGFYSPGNNKVKDYNNYKNVEYYINNNCAYGCKYFIMEKTK